MTRHLTVDFEDFRFDNLLNYGISSEIRYRALENCLEKLFTFSNESERKFTFFVTGVLAERAPDLIKQISLNGHEVASHGYRHVKAHCMTKEELRYELQKSIQILEDVTNQKCLGYRSPMFGLSPNDCEHIGVIDELFSYDSSILLDRNSIHVAEKLNADFKLKFYFSLEDKNRILPMRCGGTSLKLHSYRKIEQLVQETEDIFGHSYIYVHPYEICDGSLYRELRLSPLVENLSLAKFYLKQFIYTDFNLSLIHI